MASKLEMGSLRLLMSSTTEKKTSEDFSSNLTLSTQQYFKYLNIYYNHVNLNKEKNKENWTSAIIKYLISEFGKT